jgi:hypothetical protein
MAHADSARRTELVVAMLDSQAWREFTDTVGTYRFLPGEFDYFLALQGLAREQIMHGVRDIHATARLVAAMDERRTGERGYRRPVLLARRQNPPCPQRAIEPSVRTAAGADALVSSARAVSPGHAEAVGRRVRPDVAQACSSSRAISEPSPDWMPLRAQALRLSDEDLARLGEAINFEQRRRRRGHPVRPPAEGSTTTADPQRPRRHAADRRDSQWQPDPARPQPIPHPRFDAETTQLHAQRP